MRSGVLFVLIGLAAPACAAGQQPRPAPRARPDTAIPAPPRNDSLPPLGGRGPCPSRMPVVSGDSGSSDAMPRALPDSGPTPRILIVRPCTGNDSARGSRP
jgi:hypothetical protein